MLFLPIHPDNPQSRSISQAVAVINRGGLIAYPTDSCYALGCHIGDQSALARIRRIRDLDKDHNFTLVCRDLTDIATYAHLDNTSFRTLKAFTPGPYTFILKASRELPRRLQHPKRKTIGIRIPEHKIAQAILTTLGEPLLSVTLQMPGDKVPLMEADEILDRLDKQIDVIVDGGHCGSEPTTIVDMVEGYPRLVRQGKGDASLLIS